jgi:carbonic anhydrase
MGSASWRAALTDEETAVSATDQLLGNNAAYAASFASGDLPMPPGKQVAVLACMDARLNVYGMLGLHEGDAHVIRNAGGVVTDDAIRSLVISQRLLGTSEIVLVHHTGCGLRLRWRPSPMSSRTSASRSPASRRAPTSRTPTGCAASSTTSPLAGSTK